MPRVRTRRRCRRWQSPYYLGAYDLDELHVQRANRRRGRLFASALTPAQVVRHYEAALATGCSTIVGATTATHLVVPADQDATLQATVTATNSTGATTAPRAAHGERWRPTPLPSEPDHRRERAAGHDELAAAGRDRERDRGLHLAGQRRCPATPLSVPRQHRPGRARTASRSTASAGTRGAGARLVTCLPSCTTDEPGVRPARPGPRPHDGRGDAGWPVTDSLTVPSSWTSGYYVAAARARRTAARRARRAPSTSSSAEPPTQPLGDPRRGARQHLAGLQRLGRQEPLQRRGHSTPAAAAPPSRSPSTGPAYGQIAILDSWSTPPSGSSNARATTSRTRPTTTSTVDPTRLSRHKLIVLGRARRVLDKAMRDALQSAPATAGVNLAVPRRQRHATGRRATRTAAARSSSTAILATRPRDRPDDSRRHAVAQPRDAPNPSAHLIGLDDLGGALRGSTATHPRDYTLVSSSLSDPWMANTELRRRGDRGRHRRLRMGRHRARLHHPTPHDLLPLLERARERRLHPLHRSLRRHGLLDRQRPVRRRPRRLGRPRPSARPARPAIHPQRPRRQ